jgi:membrane associated rhomboid family serine protease
MYITFYILIITVGVSLLAFNNHTIMSRLLFNAYSIKYNKEWWRMFSCALLHGDFWHLFINMFVLFSFGQAVEIYYQFAFGSRADILFVLLYTSSVAAANLLSYYKYQNNSHYNSVGASGAVSAIVFVSILFDPYRKIYLWGILGIPGILLGIAYLAYSYYMSKKQSDHINHEAHFYGAIYGMLFTIVFKPEIFKSFLMKLLNQP